NFLGVLAFGLSMGQWLSLPMIAAGVGLVIWSDFRAGETPPPLFGPERYSVGRDSPSEGFGPRPVPVDSKGGARVVGGSRGSSSAIRSDTMPGRMRSSAASTLRPLSSSPRSRG